RKRLVGADREAAGNLRIDPHPLVDERLHLQMPSEDRQQLRAVVGDPRTLGGQGAEVGEAHDAAGRCKVPRPARLRSLPPGATAPVSPAGFSIAVLSVEMKCISTRRKL